MLLLVVLQHVHLTLDYIENDWSLVPNASQMSMSHEPQLLLTTPIAIGQLLMRQNVDVL